jgi:transposase-like protein
MARQIEPHLASNYAAIKEQEGVSWEHLARRFDVQDPHLAAWMREQPEDGDLATTIEIPKARTRRPRQTATPAAPETVDPNVDDAAAAAARAEADATPDAVAPDDEPAQ